MHVYEEFYQPQVILKTIIGQFGYTAALQVWNTVGEGVRHRPIVTKCMTEITKSIVWYGKPYN
jgi:hypothetical protein